MRRIVKGEKRQITMALEQRDNVDTIDIDSADYKIFDIRGEVLGLIDEGAAAVLDGNRVTTLFDSTLTAYDRGKTYFVRFFVDIDSSPKIIAGTVEIRIV